VFSIKCLAIVDFVSGVFFQRC